MPPAIEQSGDILMKKNSCCAYFEDVFCFKCFASRNLLELIPFSFKPRPVSLMALDEIYADWYAPFYGKADMEKMFLIKK
jgi:hypothetical protein